MSKEVEQIINILCEKLGVAASVLIPEIAKKSIVQDATATFICAAIVIAMVVVIRKILCSMDDSNDIFDRFIALMAPVICIGIVVPISAYYIVDLAGWIASPTAMAIKQITQMIK